MADNYQPIENYGVIGNLQTVALVAIDGSIDFMCFPYFDSPTVFGALLDHERGGRFSISASLQNSRPKQMYISNSNILITRFLSPDGVAELVDFMPISLESTSDKSEPVHQLIRRVQCVRGEVKFKLSLDPRLDYGRAPQSIKRVSDHQVLFLANSGPLRMLRFRSHCPVRVDDNKVTAEFVLRSGETALFSLDSDPEVPDEIDANLANTIFDNTLKFWQGWVSKSTYRGRWREVVDRSALVLKLLTSQKYGSIIAAPTFGLPESIGGGRNWDYRYTWIRDASFTLYALSRLGFHAESKAFMRWLEERCRSLKQDEPLQIMYAADGNPNLPETVLSHWEGYRKSSPVRIGNGAANHLQLDIYGELLDSIYLYNKYGEAVSNDLWSHLVRLLNWVCKNWDQPDEGIWEVRGGKKELLYSRLMCWVAIDRGLRLADKRSFPAPVSDWKNVRDTIYNQIYHEFWNSDLHSFVQSRSGNTLDAAALLAPLVRFISPTDPRWLSTLKAIETNLVDDSLVYRYRGDDGIEGSEGTFCMCSFWYIECLARAGEVPRARFLFEKMLGYANHLGLFAEELGPSGEHLGNFPQAFTHLALISAAYELNRQLGEGK
ncbi:MAG: glycoside hydrolase family 15 protein [Verrucomicrobia bacterium]|nr:glycoside hydrolase family 15 protein [Verrucomicrobiota bacterium]